MSNEEFTAEMSAQRDTIKLLVGKASSSIMSIKSMPSLPGQNASEMIANITLGLRHLEDAAMRFGKAIQASSGGISPLGGPDTPSGGQLTPRPNFPTGPSSNPAYVPAIGINNVAPAA